MSRKFVIFFLCAFTAILSSCTRTEEIHYESGMGGIRLALDTEIPATRADVTEGSLNPNNFKVEIINSKGVIFKRWKTFAEYKEQESTAFVMNAGGPYTVRATYGDSLASGFDAFFFMGEQEFYVQPQETVDLNVTCRMANVKVAVAYGENVQSEYVDYTTTVKNSKGSLVFSKDCTEAGYLPVEDLDVTMTLTDADGKTWYFKSQSKISAAAGDFIKLNLDTKEIPEYGVGIEINIDRTTNDSTVVIEIPTYMLPAPAPDMTLEGFDAETGVLSVVEGTAKKAVVNMEVFSGIQSCTMTVNSSYLVGSLQWPSEIDFLNLETSTKNLLDQYGLIYGTIVAEGTLANIEFTDLPKKLKYSTDEASNTHSFTITVVDGKGKTLEKTVSIVPTEANKSIAFSDGDVWAKRLYATLSTSDGDPALLVPQISTDGQSWSTPAYTETVSGTDKAVTITGLSDSTVYQVRAAYYDNATAAKSFTTEKAAQVQNAGFEEWTTETHEFKYKSVFVDENHNILWDRPWTDVQWWDVNSKKAMPSSTKIVSNNWNWVRFPTVAYTTDAHSDSKAAMVYSVNVGDWLTAAALVGDRIAGELFIGTADDSGNQSSTGHEFGSRPSKLVFQYKYSPVDNEQFYVKIEFKSGSQTISSVEKTIGGEVLNWARMEIPISYSNTALKASSIFITFKSSTAEEPAVVGNKTILLRDNEEYTGNFGSILYLDSIELIYE